MMMRKMITICVWLLCIAQLYAAASDSDPLNFHGELLNSNNDTYPAAVKLHTSDDHVVIENGIVEVTLSKSSGLITGVKYGGINNLLEIHNKEGNRGYWDVEWYEPGGTHHEDWLVGTNFRVITQNDDQVEVSFTKTWNPTMNTIPLNVDKRLIIKRGSSGFYVYSIMERLEGWPDVDFDEIRIVFKLRNDKFHYMAVSDEIQRVMPTPTDCRNGERLAYKEATRLINPSNPDLKGEVDDKYQYSIENQDYKVQGWVSKDPAVGFWIIKPSNEYVSGGPNKPDLISHVGPTALCMFTSVHYAGKDFNTEHRNGEPWKKVFGPLFVYLNSISPGDDLDVYQTLWRDASRKMVEEVNSWPYDFPQSRDFLSKDERGNVLGRIIVRDRSRENSGGSLRPASHAYVGLAAPGDAGSWQYESKGYQFWSRADEYGNFLIENVRPGLYNLYAWAPGFIGDYKYDGNITINPGSRTNLGLLVYSPPRNGPTLWEIGIPDRSAAEFFVPDPDPTLVNRLYTHQPWNRYRQYGLWKRYSDLYPNTDLVYNVGSSNYSRDWFFAHVTRDIGNNTFRRTTWRVNFELQNVNYFGVYTLQLALASAFKAEVQGRFNNPRIYPAHFTTGVVGKDNAIARHGIHGLYWRYSFKVPGYLLRQGSNTLYLTQPRAYGPFQGVMYDYIRLEGPTT